MIEYDGSYLILRYRESFSIANNLCFYAVLFKASQDNVLPPPEAKES
jgi:hypothetical protein